MAKYAQEEYARLVEQFRKLDDKAAAVGNYLGAGSGLLTLGAVGGVAAGAVGVWTTLAAVPSVALALAALVVATLARRTVGRPVGPSVARGVAFAEFYQAKAAAAFLGCWHEMNEAWTPLINEKGFRVNRAVNLFCAAVVALALPLAVAVGRKLCGLAP